MGKGDKTKKVIVNTAYKFMVETNDGAWRLSFTRRYYTETTMTGRIRYVYAGWEAQSFHLAWGDWKKYDARHIPSTFKDKKTIIEFIKHRPAFSQATIEISK